MYANKLLGGRHPSCACGRMKEFASGEEIARSLGNGRVISRSGTDIAEISRSDADRDPSRIKISVGISNGWAGIDLYMMMGEERIHTGRITADARLAGTHFGRTGKVRWGENIVEEYTEDIERWLATQRIEENGKLGGE